MSIQTEQGTRIFELVYSSSSFILLIYYQHSDINDDNSVLHSVLSIDEVILSNMTLLDIHTYIQNKLHLPSICVRIFNFSIKKNSKIKFKTILYLIRNGNLGEDICELLNEQNRLLPIVILLESNSKNDEYIDTVDQQIECKTSIILQQHSIDSRISSLIMQAQEFDERFESLLIDYKDETIDSELYKNMLSILSEQIMKLVLTWDSLNISEFEEQEKIRESRKKNTSHLISICDKIDAIIISMQE